MKNYYEDERERECEDHEQCANERNHLISSVVQGVLSALNYVVSGPGYETWMFDVLHEKCFC